VEVSLKAKYRGAGRGQKRLPTVNQLRASARKRMMRGLPLSDAQKAAVAHWASGYVPGVVPYIFLKAEEPKEITIQDRSWW